MAEISSAQEALAIVTICPFPLLIINKNGKITGYNRAFERLVGAAAATQLDNPEFDSMENHPAQALLSGERTVRWMDENNNQRYFEVLSTKLPGNDQFEARFFVDITRQVELEDAHELLNKEFQEHVLTDPVTGLLNRRGVMLALEPQVARSRRYNSPISIVMLDFHGGGDRNRILVAIARLLKDQLRWADLVACTDRQEFVLVLPETTAEAALKLADKLRAQLHELAAEIDPANPLWTCYGVTDWRKSDNANTLLKRAGVALTQARSEQSGKLVAI